MPDRGNGQSPRQWCEDVISTLTKFLREAVQQVPPVRYAFGAAGIAAAGALITLFLGYGRPAIIVWAGTFIAMVLLLVFASVATSRNRALRQPGMMLVYAVTLFFCLFLAFTVTAFAFTWPPYRLALLVRSRRQSSRRGSSASRQSAMSGWPLT